MRRISLRAVLVALVLAAVLPGLVVVLASTWIDRERDLASARTELDTVARLAAATQEKLVEGVRRTLAAVAAAPGVRNLDTTRCTNMLDRLRRDTGDYTMVGVLDRDGNSTCHDPQALTSFNAADRSYFQRAVAAGGFASGDYMIGRQSGVAAVGFGMAVFDDGGRLSGVAFASIDLRRVSAQLKALNLPPGMLVQLTDAAGTVLASNQSQITSVGAPLAPPALLQALTSRKPGMLDVHSADGKHWLHVLLPVGTASRDGLFVAVSTREDAVLAPSTERLERQLLAMLVAGSLGGLIAWWLSRHLVRRPMLRLLDRVQRLEQVLPAEVAEPPSLKGRTAEFLALDTAVYELGRRLRQREKERDALLIETQAQAGQLWKVQRLARIAYWEISLPDGTMAPSESLANIMGRPMPHRLSERFAMVHPADVSALKRCLIEAMAGQDVIDIEFRLFRPDGSECWVHALGELELGGDRSPRRLVGALQDISERRHAELALREHQARQDAAVAAARLGLFEEDVRTGAVVWLGHHEELWGYAPGEFDGSVEMFTQRIHPDDIAAVTADVDTSLRLGLPFRCEYRVVWPDGSVHWIVDSGSVVYADDGEPVRKVGVVMDITVQKQAQLKLAEMARRISGILESTSDGFVAIDREWRVTQANRHGATVLGYEPDQMIGRTLLELFPFGGGSDFDRACQKAMREGREQHCEVFFPGWDRWFEDHIYPTDEGLSIFFRDVTERRRAEEDINALVSRLQGLRDMDRALLQVTSTEAVVRLGLSRLRALLHCTRTAYMRFGPNGESIRVIWTEGEGAPAFPDAVDLPMPDVGPKMLETMLRDGLVLLPDLLAMGPLTPVLQRMADHGVRSFLAMPLRAEDTLIGVATMWSIESRHFNRDRITVAEGIVDRLNIAFSQMALRERIERHASELEQRVADRTAEVEAANRELEAFSYSVSHDLRAPLQSIGGFSHVLLARHAAQLDEKGRHYLQRITAGARQMETLISDLLSLAQVSHAALEAGRVDLAAVARESFGRLQDGEPERVVEMVVPAHLPAWGDHLLLRVLLDNLLGNAWKFTARTARPRIELGVEAGAAGEQVFFVADNGVGFDMQFADRLFTAFKRLHASHEFPGTGIGLATVQRIVVRHGGRVWAESTPDVATVIRFALPLPPAKAGAEAPRRSASGSTV